MVAKWERGAKGVSARYRTLFCLVFGLDQHALGFDRARKPNELVAPGAGSDDRVLATFNDAATLLDELGPAAAILQPRMFDAWKDEIMRRRALLKVMGLAPAAALTSSGASSHPTTRLSPDTARSLDDLVDRYQLLYHSAAPAALLTPVLAHLQTVGDALRESSTASLRRKFLANRARVATLAGRLAYFDLQDPMAARSYYNVALEAAREAGDHHQAAAVLGHVAFIPAAEHAVSPALDYLQAAQHHLDQRSHGGLRSWLAAVESEIHSNAGHHDEALGAIDRAREALANPGLNAELPWFDYYDPTRLAGFAGYATLRAGRHDEARTALTEALAYLPRAAVKQRAVFLTDLATVHLHDDDLDEACRTASDAVDELHPAGYATGFDRLREFRAAVEPWQDSRSVRALDDQLATVA